MRTDETPASALSEDDLEAIVFGFEDAWKRGQRPAIEDHLPAANPGRHAVLVELVHADLDFRLGPDP